MDADERRAWEEELVVLWTDHHRDWLIDMMTFNRFIGWWLPAKALERRDFSEWVAVCGADTEEECRRIWEDNPPPYLRGENKAGTFEVLPAWHQPATAAAFELWGVFEPDEEFYYDEE
jgi:hypothetical protein